MSLVREDKYQKKVRPPGRPTAGHISQFLTNFDSHCCLLWGYTLLKQYLTKKLNWNNSLYNFLADYFNTTWTKSSFKPTRNFFFTPSFVNIHNLWVVTLKTSHMAFSEKPDSSYKLRHEHQSCTNPY